MLSQTGQNQGTAATIREPLAVRLREHAEQLQRALRLVVDEVAVATPGPSAVATELRIHRTLASRLLNALRTEDTLASVLRLPRREGLSMFLAAAKRSAQLKTVAVAESAVANFDAFVRKDLGGWDALDAAISVWLPEAREKFEASNRQMVFKGMANLFGAQVDVHAITAIYHPSPDGQRCDIAVITGLYGLRRLRPGTPVPVNVIGADPKDPRGSYPIEWLTDDDSSKCPLLHRFSSQQFGDLAAVPDGKMIRYMLVGDEIGTQSDADAVTAFVTRGLRPLFHDPQTNGRQRVVFSGGIEMPARTLLLHVLVDDRVFPQVDPELIVYDTHIRGLASANDPDRDADRMESMDSIQFLGRGASRFRTADVGRHVDQVQYVCDRLGWDSSRLRGFRCRAVYPLMHAQYSIYFDPPARDVAGGPS